MRTARSLVLSSRAGRVSLADAQALSLCLPRSTTHARRRAAQRNLADDAVAYIVIWGRLIQRNGVEFYLLARKDIPAQDRRLPQFMRLAGAAVLMSLDGAVITLYRGVNRPRDIQRKMKYRIVPGWPAIHTDLAERDEACDDSFALAQESWGQETERGPTGARAC